MDEPTGELLSGAARSLRRRFVAALKEYDVTPAQARALRAVSAEPGLRLAALADALRMAPRSATEVVDALESRGLVQRRTVPNDRRVTAVVLTPLGEQTMALVDRIRRQESEAFMAPLSDSDRSALDRILRQLERVP